MKVQALALILFFSLFSLLSYSQNTFVKGGIIGLKGDTMAGKINYGMWDKNPEKVEFRKTERGKSQIFWPHEIKSFYVTYKKKTEVYEGAIVTVDYYPHDVQRMKNVSNTHKYSDFVKKDSVFLRLELEGRLSLYYLLGKSGKKHFFIKDRNGKLEELEFVRYLKEDKTGQFSVKEEYRYRGQLGSLMKDCPEMGGQLGSLAYKSPAMMKLLKDYHRYTGHSDEITYEKIKEKLKTKFGVAGGVTISETKFVHGSNYLEESDFTTSTTLTGGVFLDLIFPRNFQKVSLYNELAWRSIKTSGFGATSPAGFISYEIELHNTYIQFSHLLRYKLSRQDKGFFIQGGVSQTYSLKKFQ